uniref:Ig-like domain-containing protein n=1 Tax=Poecilia latipinna TaxID=48699 RepID=A0A3B3VA53_9TELE
MQSGQHKSYTLQPIKTAHSGEYQCCGVRKRISLTKCISFFLFYFIFRNCPYLIGEMITLTCEVQGGETTEWTCEWRRDGRTVARRNDKVWTVGVSEFSSGDYMCQCRRRDDCQVISQWYDDSAPLLLSPVHPVTEGDPVTLSCRDKKQQLLSKVFFYHNDKLLSHDSRGELNISAVSKSDEGFYKCQRSGKDSPRSWMSIVASRWWYKVVFFVFFCLFVCFFQSSRKGLVVR